tara:strand:+ start:1959 stop:2255 length:297 start_codon:yes stop_codon:yes gene_type:complete
MNKKDVKDLLHVKKKIGKYGDKFQLILFVNDEDHFAIYGNHKGSLKKVCKQIAKVSSIRIEIVEYWKNDEDEYCDCGFGSQSMMSFEEWAQEFNWKNK